MIRWQCQHVGNDGEQCENTALHRLQFELEHPFNHIDLCPEHKKYYTFSLWEESLDNWPEVT